MTTILITIIVCALLAIVMSTIAILQARRYANTNVIIATIHTPEAKMSTSASLTDAQSDKVSIAVHNARGVANIKDVASWSSSDEAVVKVSPTDPNPANPTTPDPLGRVMWLVGEAPGTATVTIGCAGGSLAISVIVSASPVSIDATIDAPVDIPPPAAPVAPAA